MSDEAQGFDPYAAVLADMKAKRDQLDQAIKVIEALRSGGSAPAQAAPQEEPAYAAVNAPGAFLGMTIPEAAKKLLAARKKTLTNPEIAKALKEGGLALQSADPVNTVGSVLTRRFNLVGDIVKVARGTWGLLEWYPGRNFKRKNGGKGDANPESFADVSTELEPQK